MYRKIHRCAHLEHCHCHCLLWICSRAPAQSLLAIGEGRPTARLHFPQRTPHRAEAPRLASQQHEAGYQTLEGANAVSGKRKGSKTELREKAEVQALLTPAFRVPFVSIRLTNHGVTSKTASSFTTDSALEGRGWNGC